MITEQDLIAAIAECQGKRDPDANTCKNLAAYLIIKDALYPAKKPPEMPMPSYSMLPPVQSPVPPNTVTYNSGSEFSQAIQGKDAGQIWAIIDELMNSIAVLYPPLYNAVLRKLQE